jgi:hypothetical protein
MASERRDPGGKRVARIERVMGVPMLVLALVYIAALVVEYQPDASADLHQRRGASSTWPPAGWTS